MTTYSLLPQGKLTFFYPNGSPLAAGSVGFYQPGTLNPATTYQDSAGQIPNANPIALDANGQCVAWGSGSYRQIVKDVNGNTIWDQVITEPLAQISSALSANDSYGLLGSMSYAQLRAYSGSNSTVNVWGITSIFDGAAGVFKVNPSDTTSTDNGGTILVDAQGRRWYRVFTGPLNVFWFGAKGDGVSDDTTAIQSAISASPSGGKVYAPKGAYLLTNQITSNSTVLVYGDGFSTTPSVTLQYVGTVFICSFLTATAANVFLFNNQRSGIENCEIFCNYQPAIANGWTPTTTPNAIQFYRAAYANVGADDPIVRHVMIRGMTTGVYCNGVDRGEFDIYGQTFGPLIFIDGSFDTAKIKNLHHWTFYSGSQNVLSWQRANADVLKIGRCDNPMGDDIFGFAVRSGIYYVSSSRAEGGGSQRGTFGNVEVDDCYFGILANSNALVTAEIANLTCYNNSTGVGSGVSPSRGIFATGSNIVTFKIGNAHFTGPGGESIRAEVAGSEIQIGTLGVDSYNQQNNGFAAVYGGVGVSIKTGSYTIQTAYGNGSSAFSATGATYDFKSVPVILSANPGYEQYTAVINGTPTTVYRNFGRAAITISASGYTNWSVTLPQPCTNKVLSARASLGGLPSGGMVDIFDSAYPLTGSTTANGKVYTTNSSGTAYVDWEVIGY